MPKVVKRCKGKGGMEGGEQRGREGYKFEQKRPRPVSREGDTLRLATNVCERRERANLITYIQALPSTEKACATQTHTHT